MPTYEELQEQITKEREEHKKEIAVLRDEMGKMTAIIALQSAEIERLRDIINKNSGNSSKPPSSDGLKKIPNLREKSDKKPGGQVGHKGFRLTLPENAEELIKSGKIEKRIIDHREEESEEYISRYTLDIEIKTVLTEHRYGKTSEIPEEMLRNEVTYGNTIKAMTAVLSAEEVIADRRMSEFYKSVTEGIICPSTGSINNFLRETADKTDMKALEESLLKNDKMNADETPMRTTEREIYDKNGNMSIDRAENTSRQVCVRTHSNEETTLYTVNGQKNLAGVERDGILTRYDGILIHDFDKKYFNFAKKHALCGAHILRELQGLDKSPEPCRIWAKEMSEVLGGMVRYKKSDLTRESDCCSHSKLKTFKTEFAGTVRSGQRHLDEIDEKSIYRGKMENLLDRLDKYEKEYMRFMTDYSVPFTNNLAERDLRPCKTKQKVSGCFRSFNGIKSYCKIRSVISTAKKRGMDLLGTFKKIVRGEPVFS